MGNDLVSRVRFDGLVTHEDGDQYISRCRGGAINLNIYYRGHYGGCTGCEYQEKCKKSALTAGEQEGL